MQGRVNGMLLEMHVCTSIPMDYLKGYKDKEVRFPGGRERVGRY